MIRKIIHIDEDKCTGCGLCADACHEGAIGMVHGKAKLLKDDYCDGLGDCLPACPTQAISFIEREAAAYDEAAVIAHRIKQKSEGLEPAHDFSCPGTRAQNLTPASEDLSSQLRNWPVQIKLAPLYAPYYNQARLLISADCTAYAYGDFHRDYIRDRVVLIGCPKLDDSDYSEKLTEIIKNNAIQEITVVRMEVPCCGGMERAVKTALQNSGKSIPLEVVTFSTNGQIL